MATPIDTKTQRSEMKNTAPQKTEEPEPTQQVTVVEELQPSNEVKWVQKTLYTKMGGAHYRPYREIVNEFKGFKDWKPSQFSSTAWKKHGDKNRYADQMCMDQTRVVLKNREATNDYINASWMTMPDGRKWISTQGPIKSTIEDFWHMIYTENVKVICMLCSFQEDGVEKSCEYFNLEGKKTETYGVYKVRVKTKSTEPFSSIKQTVLEVEKKNSKTPPITVTHLWNHGWVDHFCPLDTSPCVWMFKESINLTGKSPILVHCSAGIGRTATFVGIDYACQKIKVDPETKMSEVLFSLRRMRLRAIQSQLQYAFLHQCVVELFMQDGQLKKDETFDKLKVCFEHVVKKMIKTQSEVKKQYYAEKAGKDSKDKGGEKGDKKEEKEKNTSKNCSARNKKKETLEK